MPDLLYLEAELSARARARRKEKRIVELKTALDQNAQLPDSWFWFPIVLMWSLVALLVFVSLPFAIGFGIGATIITTKALETRHKL